MFNRDPANSPATDTSKSTPVMPLQGIPKLGGSLQHLGGTCKLSTNIKNRPINRGVNSGQLKQMN